MGAGIHLPRALNALVAPLLATACVDFVAPDLPEIGAPAVFQGALRVRADGSVQVDGQLAPGLDEDGFRRRVAREAVVALGRMVAPGSTAPNGTRSYFDEWSTTIDSVAGTLTLEAPAVEGVGPPPAIRWSGLAKLDSDTVPVAAGEDLVLRVRLSGADEPPPLNDSWLLQLTGEEGQFRIGADGAPPDSIVVPARWLPAPDDGVVLAELGYTRTTSVRPAMSDYVGLFLLGAGVSWTVRVTGGPPADVRTCTGGR